MKYNKYFEASAYRETNKDRFKSIQKHLKRRLFNLVLISFGTCALCLILVDHAINFFTVAPCILWAINLALIWDTECTRTIATIRQLFWDIDMLTYKIESMQSDTEEDYELVGDRDD